MQTYRPCSVVSAVHSPLSYPQKLAALCRRTLTLLLLFSLPCAALSALRFSAAPMLPSFIRALAGFYDFRCCVSASLIPSALSPVLPHALAWSRRCTCLPRASLPSVSSASTCLGKVQRLRMLDSLSPLLGLLAFVRVHRGVHFSICLHPHGLSALWVFILYIVRFERAQPLRLVILHFVCCGCACPDPCPISRFCASSPVCGMRTSRHSPF